MLAAKGAGMHCIVIANGCTEKEDFSVADLIVPKLGDAPDINVTIDTAKALVGQGG